MYCNIKLSNVYTYNYLINFCRYSKTSLTSFNKNKNNIYHSIHTHILSTNDILILTYKITGSDDINISTNFITKCYQ